MRRRVPGHLPLYAARSCQASAWLQESFSCGRALDPRGMTRELDVRLSAAAVAVVFAASASFHRHQDRACVLLPHPSVALLHLQGYHVGVDFPG